MPQIGTDNVGLAIDQALNELLLMEGRLPELLGPTKLEDPLSSSGQWRRDN